MKNKFLSLVAISLMFAFMLSSCTKENSTNSSERLNSNNSNEVVDKLIDSNISEISNEVSEDTFLYEVSDIQIENKIKDITTIVKQNDFVFGTGYTVNEYNVASYTFFLIDVKNNSSVFYYPYLHPEEHSVIAMAATSEKEIFFIDYVEKYELSDTASSGYSYNLNMIDIHGNIGLSVNLDEYMNGEDSIFTTLAMDNNNIFVQTSKSILVFNKQGSLLFNINLNDDDEYYYFNTYFPLLSLYNGLITLPHIVEDQLILSSVDINTQKLEQIGELPIDYTSIYSGYEENLEVFMVGEDSIFSHSLTSGENHRFLNLLSIGLNPFQVSHWSFLSSDQIAFLYQTETYITKVSLLTKTKVQQNSQKILKLASLSPNIDVVSKFNRSSKNYRIEIVDYSKFVVGRDYSEAINQLNLDIMTGNIPDIIDLFRLEYKEFANSGLLSDIYSFFEKDEAINIDLLFKSVSQSLELEGKLFAIPTDFSIGTILGVSSSVGNNIGITLDEFINLRENLDENVTLFNNMPSAMFIDLYCEVNSENFIDFEQRIANFDSEEFVNALEFSKSFNAVSDTIPTISSEDSLMYGESILLYRELRGISDLYVMEVETVGKDITAIGIPQNAGNGSIMYPNNLYGICNNSYNSEGAWEFIKFLLSEDFQRSVTDTSIPVLESVFFEEIYNLMNPIYVESSELGKQYPAMTQEQANEIHEIILTSKINKLNKKIADIINEEVGSFFADAKSAEVTASLINNRIEVLLNESA